MGKPLRKLCTCWFLSHTIPTHAKGFIQDLRTCPVVLSLSWWTCRICCFECGFSSRSAKVTSLVPLRKDRQKAALFSSKTMSSGKCSWHHPDIWRFFPKSGAIWWRLRFRSVKSCHVTSQCQLWPASAHSCWRNTTLARTTMEVQTSASGCCDWSIYTVTSHVVTYIDIYSIYIIGNSSFYQNGSFL